MSKRLADSTDKISGSAVKAMEEARVKKLISYLFFPLEMTVLSTLKLKPVSLL